jgi:hypothetical protein
MKRAARSCAGACLLAIALTVSGARAEAEDSDGLIAAGLELRREGKDAEALEHFTRAHALQPSARALAQIALAEQALGLWVAAEEHLARALASDNAWIASRRPILEDALTVIRSHLGTLEIHGAVPGLELLIDGVRVAIPRGGLLRLPVGQHEVVARAEGFVPVTRQTEVAATRTSRLDLALKSRAAPPPPARPLPAALPAAREASGEPWHRVAAWVGIGAAGLFLSGALVAQARREHSLGIYNDDSRCLQGELSRSQRCGEHLNDAEAAGRWAVAGYVAGGIALGVSIGLFAVGGSDARTSVAVVATEPRSPRLQFSARLP